MKTISMIFAVGWLSIFQFDNMPSTTDQEPTQTVPQEETPSIMPVPSPSDLPTAPPQSVLQSPLVDEVAPGTIPQDLGAPSVGDFLPMTPSVEPLHPCEACCRTICHCPVRVAVLLVEPGCGCSHEVCLTLPTCCVGKVPEVSWRNGILGRKIAKLCWPSCNKRVKVVIPAIGGPRVWE